MSGIQLQEVTMLDAKSLLSNVNANGLVGKLLGGMATKQFAGGLLAGGLASQLVSKDTLEGAAKLGGLALLGTLAYKSYNAYQANKAAGGSASVVDAVKQGAGDMVTQGKALAGNFKSLIANAQASTAAAAAPALAPAQTNELALAVIRAMIGAAKADGKVDAEETQRILGHLEGGGLEANEKSFLMTELANAQEVHQIAAGAKTPEEAAEVYLAALLVCDNQCAAEQAYLSQLATALKLEPGFTQALQAELLKSRTAQAA
ncbi:MAG: tellurite resistance TerB family protein [Rickettsiales bacterium]|nr:tellurite resistance TerB family protein [Rickettsiales bacterium]